MLINHLGAAARIRPPRTVPVPPECVRGGGRSPLLGPHQNQNPRRPARLSPRGPEPECSGNSALPAVGDARAGRCGGAGSAAPLPARPSEPERRSARVSLTCRECGFSGNGQIFPRRSSRQTNGDRSPRRSSSRRIPPLLICGAAAPARLGVAPIEPDRADRRPPPQILPSDGWREAQSCQYRGGRGGGIFTLRLRGDGCAPARPRGSSVMRFSSTRHSRAATGGARGCCG